MPARQAVWNVQLYMVSKMGKDTLLEASEANVSPKTFLEEMLRKRKPWWKVLPVDEIDTQSSFENLKSINKYHGILV